MRECRDRRFDVVIYLLFGGLQTVWGPVMGAAVLTALPELLRFTSQYRLILFGLAITVVVLVRPEGLLTRRLTRSLRPPADGEQTRGGEGTTRCTDRHVGSIAAAS